MLRTESEICAELSKHIKLFEEHVRIMREHHKIYGRPLDPFDPDNVGPSLGINVRVVTLLWCLGYDRSYPLYG